jgi:hypothetical protein
MVLILSILALIGAALFRKRVPTGMARGAVHASRKGVAS